MKAISAALAEHLAEDLTSLAYCWAIRRGDGHIVALTSHDRPIITERFRFLPGGAGRPTAIESSGSNQPDSVGIEAVLDSPAIEESDLVAGRFDRAFVSLYLVNWRAPSDGMLLLKQGRLGSVRTAAGRFEADIVGLQAAFNRPLSGLYSPECRAEFGDGKCRINLPAFQHYGRVASVASTNSFNVEGGGLAASVFARGLVMWVSGENAALEVEIDQNTPTLITLVDAMPRPISDGDRFRLTQGCDKRLQTCRDRFANQRNFRGEPFVPGVDVITDYPGIP